MRNLAFYTIGCRVFEDMYRILYFLPKNHVSHWMGLLLNIRWPKPIACWLVGFFAKLYNINLKEAENPIDSYSSIGDLFIRKLKADARPIHGDLVHPVDAVISQMGKITNHTLIQAKGKTYTTHELLKSDTAAKFEGGMFITYYLCPTDYHRIHSPVTGIIEASTLIPGKLWPVNTWSVDTIENLFSVNERLVSHLQTSQGENVAVVKVGATNVGKITLSYDSSVVSNTCQRKISHKDYRPNIPVKAGDELGIFHMGSTVVLLLDKYLAQKISVTRTGPVKMGERLQ
jgi:phosphatidylserine decarboxylase